MTAQTFVGSRATAGVAVYQGLGSGNVCVAYGSCAISEAVEVGDIWQLCKLPKGAVVVGGYMALDDVDSGAETLDIDLGYPTNGVDTADPDAYVNSAVLTGDALTDLTLTGAANLRLITRLSFTALGAETTVQAVANAVAAAGGTGTISCVIYYVVA